MKINFIKKISIALSFLTITSFAHAGINQDKIPCPAINLIQSAAQKIDAGKIIDGAYVVYSSKPVFFQSKLPWYVAVSTQFQSKEEALNAGKEIVQGISQKIYEDAVSGDDNIFFCAYNPGGVVAIGGDISGEINENQLLRIR